MDKKAIFVGVARNCAQHVRSVLNNISRLEESFSQTGYIFVENDSVDETKSIIGEWGKSKSNFFLLNFDGLGIIKQRGLRLEIARNAYYEFIKSHNLFSTFDLMIVVDMDDANSFTIDINSFRESIDFLYAKEQHAAVFANQLGTYYDMWTLRHSKICNVDIWEEVFDFVLNNQCTDEEAFMKTLSKRVFSINKNDSPLEVDSAFGGLGIYKLSYVLRNQNPYLGSRLKIISKENQPPQFCRFEMCEHVHFNMGIRNLGGKLYIYPKLINGINLNLTFPASAYRQFIF